MFLFRVRVGFGNFGWLGLWWCGLVFRLVGWVCVGFLVVRGGVSGFELVGGCEFWCRFDFGLVGAFREFWGLGGLL